MKIVNPWQQNLFVFLAVIATLFFTENALALVGLYLLNGPELVDMKDREPVERTPAMGFLGREDEDEFLDEFDDDDPADPRQLDKRRSKRVQ